MLGQAKGFHSRNIRRGSSMGPVRPQNSKKKNSDKEPIMVDTKEDVLKFLQS